MITKIVYSKLEDVLDFIKNSEKEFRTQLLEKINFSRVCTLADFKKYISDLNENFKKVAVISGSENEPELKYCNYDHLDILDFNPESDLFNLDNEWQDIFQSNFGYSKFYKKDNYDLVLCNQVLEHIYNPFQAIKNIHFITKKNGYAWISIPTINCIHGEPYFYSSGYHPRYLERLCLDVGFEVKFIGAFGNRKYLSYAVNGKWMSHNELKRGFRAKRDFAFPYFALIDGRVNDITGNFITDTWILIRKT